MPEDRRREGLVLIHSIRENAIAPISSQLTKNHFFNDDKKANEIVAENIKDLGVVCDSMNQEIGLLSGGNQQKIVIAKCLNAKFLILSADMRMVAVL